LYPEDFAELIQQFLAGGEPPFVVSDAWPGDLLPVPAHIPIQAEPGSERKKLKHPLVTPNSSFQLLAKGSQRVANDVTSAVFKPLTRVQTAIDRDSGTAAEGQLYETDCQYVDSQGAWISIYIRTERHLDRLVACFRAMALCGYGKKSSSGLGEFEVLGEPDPCDWLDDVPGANGFVALNHFVPAPGDPTDGQWRTHVTFPKFHANAVGSVFKGVILMLAPGSVFRSEPPRSWYGSVIPMPRPEMPSALHYGLCFPAPVKLEEVL
jgi:CRISPR-associated protein Csm4